MNSDRETLESGDNGIPLRIESNNDQKHISLKIETEKFNEFISSIFGKRYNLRKKHEGKFILHKDNIIDIDKLVNQSIEQQFPYKKIETVFDIHYSDGTSISIPSMEDYLDYRDFINNKTFAVSIYFSFLIFFGKDQVPEKQEIIIEYNANESLIETSINHTNRPWADSINNTLYHYFSKFSQKKTFIQKNVDKFFVPILWTIFIFFVFLAFFSYGIEYLSEQGSEARQQHSQSFDRLNNINEKVDYIFHNGLLKDIVPGSPYLFLSISAFLLVSLIAVGGIVEAFKTSNVYKKDDSVIVFSDFDEKYYVKWKRKEKFFLLYRFGGWFLAIILSILANYITEFYMLPYLSSLS